jgi:hypothetical protein
MLRSGGVIQGVFCCGQPANRGASSPAPPRGVQAFPVRIAPGGAGQPLPKDIQAKMESAFAASFADVRVSVGPAASSVGALAFTHGSHICFAPGHYNPHTPAGLKLLGHELTHVLQQRAGRVVNPFGSGVAAVHDPLLEAEAERHGNRVALSQTPVHLQTRPSPIQPKMAFPFAPVPGLAAIIQRSRAGKGERKGDDNPYKKVYTTVKPVKMKSKRKAALKHKTIKSRDTLTKRQKAIVKNERDQDSGSESEEVVLAPNYVPPNDSLGNKIWDGSRKSLSWNDTVKKAMAGSKNGGCVVGKMGCTGGGDGIDHIQPFSSTQSEIGRYVICDGRHHFSACYKADAAAVYNHNNDISGLRWACAQCNSSKGGKKGLYENPPRWIGGCPGRCGYSFEGEEAEY